MSRNNWGPWGQAIRMQQDARLMRAVQENVEDIITRFPTRQNILDIFPHSLFGGLPIDYNHDEYSDCDSYDDDDDDDDEEEYYYDVDQNTHSHREQINTFSGHSAQSPLTPHPRIKQLTSEEAEKHAKALLEEENRLKEKAEKKRLKKLRQRERKRLEKESADKLPRGSVEQGLSTSSPKKKENIKNHVLNETKEYFVGPGPDSPKTDVTLLDERHLGEDNVEDEKREEELLSSEPEELDMNSSFISTAAAIAKKQLGRKNKLERKRLKNPIAVRQAEDKWPKMNRQQVDNEQCKRDRKRLEKENTNKDKLRKCAVEQDPSTSSPKKKENKKNHVLNETKEYFVGPGPDSPKTDVTVREERHLGEDNVEDEKREEEFLSSEPEELDMNSSFISTAAAIAKKQLDKKNKLERKRRNNLIAVHQAEDNKPKMNGQQVDIEQEKVKEVEVDVVQRSIDLANTGNQFAACGQLDVAVKYFTGAIKYNPTEYKLFGNRSFCYERLQQFDLALIDADLSLGMNPGWIKGLFRKGKALCGLQRFYEAALTYQEVLQQDSSSVDASQELRKVHILQLMEMGFTHEKSLEALKAHSSFEEAVDALSVIEGKPDIGDPPGRTADEEEEWVVTQRGGHARNTPRASASSPASAERRPTKPASAATSELFPVWVGSVVSTITEQMLHRLFSRAGEVFSIKMMPQVQCAFVHYTKKQDCKTAIQLLHGFLVEGVCLAVRHPNKIHPNLGVSRNAATDPNIVCTRRSSSPLVIPNNRTINRAK
ncbi:stress-induced-phosphoprotein 1 isoform X2 [Osmerus eperlanus]|uniref:stress-induced-phosphoprotein 1 isoform X2 n=1 Tax=Osmerus eperlanus TaxID=29151 RepID=UPI002E10ACE7